MNEDRITVAVTRFVDGEPNTESYSLTFEEFSLIKPVLDGCEKNPQLFPAPPFLAGLFGNMFGQPEKRQPRAARPTFYDVSERPDGMTNEDILRILDKHNILMYDSSKSDTTSKPGYKAE